MRGKRAWVCGVFAMVLVASSAAAQSDTSGEAGASLADSLEGSARSDYDAGKILYADGDYAGALIKFQNAFRQKADARLLWNMAACEKNLRRYGSALELIERYERDGNERWTVAHRAEVKGVADMLRTLVSTVHLVVSEPGAAVFIDDRRAGTTPLSRPLYVDLGSRRIRVSKDGFQDQVITQDFAGGSDLTLLLTMAPVQSEARVSIVADDDSSISLDGHVVGRGTWEGTLLAGEHSLRVTAAGKRPYEKELVVEAGEPRTLYIRLDAPASGIPAWVWMGAGVIAAGGLATGAYFLLRDPGGPEHTEGTLPPHVVSLPLRATFR